MEKKLHPKVKFAFILVTLLFTNFYVFTQETDELNNALNEKDTEKVQTLLESSSKDNAPILEQMILDSAKTAIMNNDLDFATELSEIVLLFNFDNEQAQALYTSIEEQNRIKKAAEEAKQKEAEKLALEKAKEEEEKARLAEEQRLAQERIQKEQEQKAKEEAFIKSVNEISAKNFPIGISLIGADFDFSKSPLADEYNNTDITNTRYGFGGTINASFVHPYIKLHAIGSYSYYPIILNGQGKKQSIEARIILGSPSILGPVGLSFGYKNLSNDTELAAFYNKIAGPIIGLTIDQIQVLPSLKMSLFFDWNITNLISETYIDFAFDTELITQYTFLKKGNFNFFVENITGFDALIISDKLEWALKTSLSIGVSINDN